MVSRKILFGFLLITIGCSQHQPQTARTTAYENATINFSLNGKIPVVYTTAEKTKERISLSDKLTFENHPQPLETDVCIFVDPTHQFQTITGFGGAIVDASAETFAKLPKDKQDEILKAYYDTKMVSVILWCAPISTVAIFPATPTITSRIMTV